MTGIVYNYCAILCARIILFVYLVLLFIVVRRALAKSAVYVVETFIFVFVAYNSPKLIPCHLLSTSKCGTTVQLSLAE